MILKTDGFGDTNAKSTSRERTTITYALTASMLPFFCRGRKICYKAFTDIIFPSTANFAGRNLSTTCMFVKA